MYLYYVDKDSNILVGYIVDPNYTDPNSPSMPEPV
jgi:hypothetical protein